MDDKQYEMQLSKEYRVVTANDLIKGRQRMTLREAQLLYIAISQVVAEDKDFKTYTTTVPKLAAFMGLDESTLYHDLEDICTNLTTRVIKIRVGGDNAKGPKKWSVFHWVDRADYDSGKLTMRLSGDIKPYLLDLVEHYSQSQLGTLLTFRSYYAARLYQFLKAEANEHGKNSKTQWTFTIEEIRDLLQIAPAQYKQPRDLLKKTIKPALAELNSTEWVLVEGITEHHAKTKGCPLTGVSFTAMFFDEDKHDGTPRMTKAWYLESCKPQLDALDLDALDKEQED